MRRVGEMSAATQMGVLLTSLSGDTVFQPGLHCSQGFTLDILCEKSDEKSGEQEERRKEW